MKNCKTVFEQKASTIAQSRQSIMYNAALCKALQYQSQFKHFLAYYN